VNEPVVPVVLNCFVPGQIADMRFQMKAILLGSAMAAVACTTIIALVLSLANHQTLDQPYSTQVQSKHAQLSVMMWFCIYLD